MRRKPLLAQIETQARVTLALLPYVAALPFLDDEAIVKTFGSAMAVLNWLPTIPTLPELERPQRRPRTPDEKRAYRREYQRKYRQRKQQREEQRAYWREAQRKCRQRKKESLAIDSSERN